MKAAETENKLYLHADPAKNDLRSLIAVTSTVSYIPGVQSSCNEGLESDLWEVALI